MMNPGDLLSEELLYKVEDFACAQNRQPAEVLQDAVDEYADRQSWVNFVARCRWREGRIKRVGPVRLVSYHSLSWPPTQKTF